MGADDLAATLRAEPDEDEEAAPVRDSPTPAPKANALDPKVGRFTSLNHSCSPNCSVSKQVPMSSLMYLAY